MTPFTASVRNFDETLSLLFVKTLIALLQMTLIFLSVVIKVPFVCIMLRKHIVEAYFIHVHLLTHKNYGVVIVIFVKH